MPPSPDKPSDNGQRATPPPSPAISPLVPGRTGRPSYSLEALRERVERQFQEETALRADILLDLDSDDKRRALLEEVADYVLATEAVALSARERVALLDTAFRNLFTFGPLDEVLKDDAITEITVSGPRDIHARRGMGRLEAVLAAFDDRAHLAGIVERVMASGGAVLSPENPFVEIGVTLLGRSARLSLIGPPASPDYSLEIRLHPRQPVTLDDLDARLHAVPSPAAVLLRAILAAGHGLLIVGDVGLGKTTLASALVQTLPPGATTIAVERAAEMSLPPHVTRRTPVPAVPDRPGSDFVTAIRAALDESPEWLIVDEIRGDEAAAVWDALAREDAPRYLWVFRGASQPERLRSALGMVIRKQHPAIDQGAIHRALARHLPFVAALRKTTSGPRLHLIAEWQLGGPDDDPSLSLHPLLTEQAGTLAIQDRPVRPLDLPDAFWE